MYEYDVYLYTVWIGTIHGNNKEDALKNASLYYWHPIVSLRVKKLDV